MAQILGVSISKLGKTERCDPAVKIYCRLLCRVCDHFGISTDEILFENWPELLAASRR